MSEFINLRYVTVEGWEAPVDTSHPDSPYCHVGQTKFGLRVKNSFINRIRWTANGIEHELKFINLVIAALDPASDLLVIIVGSKDLPKPNNAVVFNPDGTLNHQIIAPAFVEQTLEHMPNKDPVLQKYPVEFMDEVLVENGRILIGLCFRYEWIERRYYDPATRQWQERDHIYRR